jgi:hypothetical protein
MAALALEAGLTVERNEYHTVANVNRKKGIKLERVYLTATLRKPAAAESAASAGTAAAATTAAPAAAVAIASSSAQDTTALPDAPS